MFDIGINLLTIAFLGLCCAAAFADIMRMKIPNSLNVAIFALALFTGLILAASGTISWVTFGWHCLVSVIALAIGFALFAFKVVGGGDAKFFPGALMWVGPAGWLHFVFYTSLFAGGLAVFTLVWRFLLRYSPTLVGLSRHVKSLSNTGNIPFGVAITFGIFLASAYSPFFGSWELLTGLSPAAVSLET